MIKTDKRNWITLLRMLLPGMAVVIAAVGQKGYGQMYDYFDPDSYYDMGYSLLIEQSPVGAGKVAPQLGVYKAGLDEVVTLTAIAKPGYQFVYWLGDVTDPTTNETMIVVDSPKIVIAVFERSKFDLPLEAGIVSGLGRGGLRGVPDFRPRGGGGGQRRLPPPPGPVEPPPEPLEHDFPVPGEPFPVPENDDEEIPEPATAALLGLGTLLLTMGRGKRKPTK